MRAGEMDWKMDLSSLSGNSRDNDCTAHKAQKGKRAMQMNNRSVGADTGFDADDDEDDLIGAVVM